MLRKYHWKTDEWPWKFLAFNSATKWALHTYLCHTLPIILWVMPFELIIFFTLIALAVCSTNILAGCENGEMNINWNKWLITCRWMGQGCIKTWSSHYLLLIWYWPGLVDLMETTTQQPLWEQTGSLAEPLHTVSAQSEEWRSSNYELEPDN